MKLKLEQLQPHLEGPLRKAYLLSGDEPQQMLEAADAIRAAARLQGFLEREIYSVEYHFAWADFRASCDALSLFGEPRLLDLRLTAKPDKEGQESILHFVERPRGQHPPHQSSQTGRQGSENALDSSDRTAGRNDSSLAA